MVLAIKFLIGLSINRYNPNTNRKKDKANGKYSFVYLYIYITFIIYRINLVIIKNGQNDNPIDLDNKI